MSCLLIAGGIGNGQVMAKNIENHGKAPKLNRQVEKIKNEVYYNKGGGWENVANIVSKISDEVLSSFANIKSTSEVKELKKLGLEKLSNNDRNIVIDYKLYRNMIENEYVIDTGKIITLHIRIGTAMVGIMRILYHKFLKKVVTQ